ncbi:Outer membrane protein TolC [Flexibacter flexilis DSM 6793]|uniref:Outer membrane protein TolC n=1 Tax=Flexibacter flexilis DSM 6793 TaxID=927664 RepID=A0A1I1M3H6_9BACT|nr:TolC family protein [Flexibacter flexilis]SFC76200.1 Outer membrane protein TolC [Flexibacter flexilis DSM 6793]
MKLSHKKFSIFVLLSLGLWPSSFAQNAENKTLSLKEFYQIIANNHPIVKQAKSLPEAAQQELRIARGGFDPKLNSSLTRKEYNGTSYYNLFDAHLKVPVWTGTDLKIGYERNNGVYLSNQYRTPADGLSYIGISVPVGQGLFIDERRSTLRQAQLFQQIAQADQVKTINKIMLSAAKDYWEWFTAQQTYNAWKDAEKLADIRYKGVRERAAVGEIAAIDTVEAFIIWQERIIQRQQADVALQNARLVVSNYLWNEENQPVEVQASLQPEAFAVQPLVTEEKLSHLKENALANHPELKKFEYKIQQLEIQRRLGREMLKPALNVNYNLLSATPTAGENFQQAYYTNNYKVGIDFSFPLLLRKERGKLQLIKVKQTQTRWEQSQTNREIMNDIQAQYNDLQNLTTLLQMQQRITQDYERLRNAELRKYEEGESSLFLINSRESKFLDAQVKMASLQAKYRKAMAMLLWAAGQNELEQQ